MRKKVSKKKKGYSGGGSIDGVAQRGKTKAKVYRGGGSVSESTMKSRPRRGYGAAKGA